MISRLAASFGLLLAGAGASCELADVKLGRTVVAVVGGDEITYDMLVARAEALEQRRPRPEVPEAAAYTQLVQGYLSAQIVNRYGDFVSDASVAEHWARQKRSLPPALRAVTADARRDALARQAIAKPDLATSLLDTLFHANPEFTREESELALRLHTEVLAAPETFDAAAAREGLAVDRLWIGKAGLRSARAPAAATAPAYTEAERYQASVYYRAFAAAAPGTVHPQPLSTPDAFQLFKIEARKKGEILVAVATIPRPGIDEWFVAESASIPVELRDRDLGRSLLKSTQWGRRLNLVNRSDFADLALPPAEAP